MLVGLNSSPCQQWLGSQTSSILSRLIGGSVVVERVVIGLFNQVTLTGVTMEDPDGQPVLQGDYLSAQIDLWPLISEGKVSFSTLALLDTQAKIHKNPDGQLNIQYIIDAFSNPNDTTPSRLNLAAGVLVMRRCQVEYETLKLKQIDLNLSVHQLTNDSIALRMRHCALQEQRGMTLKDLSFTFSAGRSGLTLRNFWAELPHSHLSIPQLQGQWRQLQQWDLNQWLSTANVRPFHIKAQLAPQDLGAFLPKVATLDIKDINLDLAASMASQRIDVSRLSLQDSQGLLALAADGNARLTLSADSSTHLTLHDGTWNLRHLHANMSLAQNIAKTLTGKELPAPVVNLKVLDAQGKASLTDPSHGVANLQIETAAGKLSSRLLLADKKISGQLSTQNFSPSVLLPEKDLPTLADFRLQGETTTDGQRAKAHLEVAHLKWNNYDFSNLTMEGRKEGHGVTIQLDSHNPHIVTQMNVSSDDKLQSLKLSANIERWSAFLPQHIQSLEGRISADLEDVLTSHPTGTLTLADVKAVTTQDDSLHIETLHNFAISSQTARDGMDISVRSDFMQAQFNGELNIKAIQNTVLQLLHENLPNLVLPEGNTRSRQRWNFVVNIHNTRMLETLFRIPVSLNQPLYAEGYLDAAGRQSSLQASAPSLNIDGTTLKNIRIYATQSPEQSRVLVQLQKAFGEKDIAIDLQALTHEGALSSTLAWQEPEENHYYGEVALQTSFYTTENHKQGLSVQLRPTRFCINDTLWNVKNGRIDYADKEVYIKDCEISNGVGQGLSINGAYSPHRNDSIVASLRELDVKYILDLVNFDEVAFEGHATGKAVLKMVEGKPQANMHIGLPHFKFNYAELGAADILGDFEFERKRLNLQADITRQGIGYTRVDCMVGLGEKKLDLHCHAQRTPIGFLNYFLEGILDDIEGETSGDFHLYGPFKQLDFGGLLSANADLTIPVTGVRYHVNDVKAEFTPGLMSFRDGHFTDRRQGTGLINGQLRHDHIKNLRYSFAAEVQKMLVYDMPQQVDWTFYSTAYGNGYIELEGKPGELMANISLTPTRGTEFTFINDSPETITDSRYIHFGSKHPTLTSQEKVADAVPDREEDDSPMDVRLNFNINVNPDAALHIVMDEKSNDVINLYGRGVINASWYNKGDMTMYGTCTVDHGVYRFSIQDLIRKNFQLKEGGEVIFAGNPKDADLKVQAVYTVNSASLADLNAGTSFSDNNIRVNCILNITGKANNPQISFDLDLPTVNEDEKLMVKKLIATEEDMNMQIIYLLGVGRFYTFNAASLSENGTNQLATNSVNSFLSNTLSSQLTEILSNALHNNNWSFGANIATGQQGWNDVQVEALLSGRLFNNRLLLNGQFGYRDKATLATSSHFIGDFDLQYLVTKNGNLRIKAYSETNDRYFTKSALTTQGLGLLLKKDLGRTLGKRIRKKKDKNEHK